MRRSSRQIVMGTVCCVAMVALTLAISRLAEPPGHPAYGLETGDRRAQADAESVAPNPFRIEEGKRLIIESSRLPATGAVVLLFPNGNDAPRESKFPVTIVSSDGRRIEVVGGRAWAPTGTIGVELDADFLRPGRYLVQLESVASHPLNLRRYVFEVR